jgi:sialic acid synthase SpsE
MPHTGSFADSFCVGPKRIGPDEPTFIIAEIGSNHDQDLSQAKKLIDIAASAGADAIKFQTLDYEELFHDPTTDDQIADLYEKIKLPEEWYPILNEYAADQGIEFLSSPTYPAAVDLLEDINVPAYKIASAQVVSDQRVIRQAALTGKPLFLSTGLGGISHIEQSLQTSLNAENNRVAVLHCVSEYPTEPADAHLRRINRLSSAFGTICGYSDHTMSIHIPVAAVAMGASIVEKHITLDRTLTGPDHETALEPTEFEQMVAGIRDVDAAVGHGIKIGATTNETGLRNHVKLKLVTTTDLSIGTRLTDQVVTSRRSPDGIPHERLNELVDAGVTLKTDLPKGSLIKWAHLTGDENDD